MTLRLLAVFFVFVLARPGYSQLTSWDWVQRQTGNSSTFTTSIACDKSSNSYIAGSFGGLVNFGSSTLTSAGLSDAYVACFAPSGALKWAHQLGARYSGQANAVAVSSTGDVYVAGYVTDSSFSDRGRINLPFVARFNSSGVRKWLIVAQGGNNSSANGIAVSHDGKSVYITGTVLDTMSIGGLGVSPWPSSYPNCAIFMTKIDSSGRAEWIRNTHAGSRSANNDAGICATVDDSEHVFFGCQFADTLNFQGEHLSGAGKAALIISLDSAGQSRWMSNFAVMGSSITGLCYSNGSLYASGQNALAMRFRPDQTVDKILGNSGVTLGAQSIAADGAGGIFLAGNFNGFLTVDSVSITNLSAKFYLLKVDTGLHAKWAAYTMISHLNTPGIAANATGDRFLSGSYTDSVRIGQFLVGTPKNISSGLVAALSELDLACGVIPTGPYCPGDSVFIPIRSVGQFLTGNAMTAELSDSLGRFLSPKPIGVIYQSTGTIAARIPTATHSGSHYRIRITSSKPSLSSDDNGKDITILSAPFAKVDPPGGAVDMCEQDSITIAASGGVRYRWSNGDTTASIRVGATGFYSVFVLSASGCGLALPGLQVTVRLRPPIPPVTRSGNTIFAGVNNVQYQWYYNHQPIAGATQSSLDMTYNGTYTITVTNLYHCSSTSEDYVVDDLLPSAVTPTRLVPFAISMAGANHLRITNAQPGSAFIEVDDILGRAVASKVEWITNSDAVFPLPNEFDALASGIYYVRVEIAGQTSSLKLIRSR